MTEKKSNTSKVGWKAVIEGQGNFLKPLVKEALQQVGCCQKIWYAGLGQREVTKALNMGTGSAVCKQRTGLAEKLEADGRLREQVAGLEAKLDSAQAGQNAAPSAPSGSNSILKGFFSEKSCQLP